MFKALDYVDYDRLHVNGHKRSPGDRERTPTNLRKSTSLQELCCDAINDSADICLGCPDLLVSAVRTMPPHLVPMLLRVAIDNHQSTAVSTIISCWPFRTLSFREVLGSTGYSDVFQDEMGLDLVVFRGLLTRRKCCKMRCLDFRGFKLNGTYCKLIVHTCPLISLKKRQMNSKRLARIITKTAGLDKDGFLSENLPAMLKDTLDTIMARYTDIHINIPRGQRLLVKIDTLNFSPGDNFYLDYLVSNCLRSITPVQVQVSNIQIRSDVFSIPSDSTDRFSPFIIIHGHDTERGACLLMLLVLLILLVFYNFVSTSDCIDYCTLLDHVGTLQGLSLRQLEDNLFVALAAQLKKFTKLRALDIQDCSIYLQEGRTRSRMAARTRITDLFSSFTQLTRLDLSFNYLLGCLGELLNALVCPLQFLGLRGCDLNESDLFALANSKHALTLRELNFSKLCQVIFFYQARIPPSTLISVLRFFPQLSVLNLAQNHIPDALVPQLCHTLNSHLMKLKVLDISANVLLPEHQLDITTACAAIPTMQKVRLTTVTSLLQEFGVLGRGIRGMQGNLVPESYARILLKLEELRRQDLVVETVNLSRTVFYDMVDDLYL